MLKHTSPTEKPLCPIPIPGRDNPFSKTKIPVGCDDKKFRSAFFPLLIKNTTHRLRISFIKKTLALIMKKSYTRQESKLNNRHDNFR